MRRLFISFLLILILSPALFASKMPWGRGLSKAEHLQFILATFGPGDDIPSYWGHTALIIEDTVLNVSAIYNFGLYSFDEDMLVHFVMGRLIFSVGRASVASYFNYYRSENRDIRLTTLDIPLKNRLKLAQKLEWYVEPAHCNYLYHHYFDNCSTRLRDLIDMALDGQFHKVMNVPGRMTLRQHTRRYVARNPVLEMLLMFLMNDTIDKPITKWDEMFLPDELERDVHAMTYTDSLGLCHPLSVKYRIWYDAHRPPVPQTVPKHEIGAFLISVVLGLVILFTVWFQIRKPFRWFQLLFSLYNFILGLVLGIPGLILFFTMFFTDHEVTFHNENILLANPLTLLIALFGIILAWQKPWAFKALRWLWYLQIFGAVLLISLKLLLPSIFDQDNLLVFAFILPVTLAMGLSFWYLKPSYFADFKNGDMNEARE